MHGDGRSSAPRNAVGSVGCLSLAVALPRTMRAADASLEGVVLRPLSTCASLLQGGCAAPLHPAQGMGLLRLHHRKKIDPPPTSFFPPPFFEFVCHGGARRTPPTLLPPCRRGCGLTSPRP